MEHSGPKMFLTLPRSCNELSSDSRRMFGVEAEWNFGIFRDVNWSDVDSNHHVNNLVFLRWCEDVRNHYSFQALGTWPDSSEQSVVVRSLRFEYERGIGLGDRALVTARTVKIGTTSWIQQYAVWNGNLVGRGEAVCVFVDGTGSKVPISSHARESFLQIDPNVDSPSP